MSQAGDELAIDTVSSDPQKSADPFKSFYSDPVRQGIISDPQKFSAYLKHQAGFPSHVQMLLTVNASRHKTELHMVFVVIMPVDDV